MVTQLTLEAVSEGAIPVPVAAPPSAWRSSCLGCGLKVEGPELPEKCPKCEGQRWIHHLAGHQAERRFDIIRERAEIAAGTSFWCRGHLAAVPVAERSPDNLDYCRACHASLQVEAWREKEDKKARDNWSGNVFYHYGKGYVVLPNGKTAVAQTIVRKGPSVDSPGATVTKEGGTKFPTTKDTSVPSQRFLCHPPNGLENANGRGRPRAEVPTAIILDLQGQGLSARRISRLLKEQGHDVSRSLVGRVLKGELDG